MPKRANLVVWQWDGYPSFHRSKANLVLHIFAVPAFIAATCSFAIGLVTFHWIAAASAAFSMIVAFAVQAIGHKAEGEPPVPFDGPGDAITRIFTEQFISFPRFVLTGAWLRALQQK